MHIFYSPDIKSDEYTLSPEESKHGIKVLRLKKGDRVLLIDGNGKQFNAILQNEDRNKCRVKIVNTESIEKRKDFELKIAIAPTKNISRFENFLEKTAEIGIDHILPFISSRSERRQIKQERSEKILIAAVKQSIAFFKPELHPLTTFESIINTTDAGEKYIAHCYPSDTKKHIKDVYRKGQNVLILIGPEGDFTEDEIRQAVQNGFKEISISGSRLRTETAGIVACHIIDYINT
jgi:16S rRNA (uracil1498-N3)-methyltransferase